MDWNKQIEAVNRFLKLKEKPIFVSDSDLKKQEVKKND